MCISDDPQDLVDTLTIQLNREDVRLIVQPAQGQPPPHQENNTTATSLRLYASGGPRGDGVTVAHDDTILSRIGWAPPFSDDDAHVSDHDSSDAQLLCLRFGIGFEFEMMSGRCRLRGT